jgi:hypothetical protein
VSEGNICSVHTDYIAMGTVDFVHGGSFGFVDASEISAFVSLIGTRCGYYSGSGEKYNPVVDFNKDGFIDGSDLGLLAQHFGHGCQQWAPTPPKATVGDAYPYVVFDLPEMQAAMRKAGVTRDFIESIWERNGPEQRLFYKGEGYDREAHLAQVRQQKAVVENRSWSQVRTLFR